MRIHPLLIRRLLFPLTIHPPHRLVIGAVDARLRRQPPQIFHVTLARVAPHNRTHRCIGFQRGRVDPDGFAFQQSAPRHFRQHKREHRLMRGLIQQPPRSRDGYVIRRGFRESIVQESPQAQTVGHSPADAPFARNPFEESDQQQSEIHARSQPRPPQFGVIKATAALLAERVKSRLVKHAV